MLTPATSRIGFKIWIAFTATLVISLAAFAFIEIAIISKFGEETDRNHQRTIMAGASAFLARTAHEQALRCDEIFNRLGNGAATIAEEAEHILNVPEKKGFPETHIRLQQDKGNGFFFNSSSATTMLIYWGGNQITAEAERGIGTISELADSLESVKRRNPEISAAFFVSDARIAVYFPNPQTAHQIPAGFDIRTAQWYQKAKEKPYNREGVVWSSVYRDILGKGLMITASMPTYDVMGKFMGAAAVDVTLEDIFSRILCEIPSPHSISGMSTFILDGQGHIITISSDSLKKFGIRVDADELTDSSKILEYSLADSSFSAVRQIDTKISDKPYGVFQLSLPHENFLIASHFMKYTGWRLNLAVPESEILASVIEAQQKLGATIDHIKFLFWIIALGFSLVSMGIGTWLTLRYLVKPLRELEKGAARVQAGDLNTPIEVTGKDEMASLARSFNNMVTDLRKGKRLEKEYSETLEKEIQEKTLELSGKTEKLELEISERKKIEEALRDQIGLQRTITGLLAKFMEVGNTDVKISEVLENIGILARVDRVYVFRLDKRTGLIHNTHEWCAQGIPPQIQNLQNIDPESELPYFWKKMLDHQIFVGPRVSELPLKASAEKAHFEQQNIQSVLVLPMISGKELTGFIGFDSVLNENHWPQNTTTLLESAVQIIGNALLRKEIEEDLKNSERHFRTLVENAPDGIFVTDGSGNYMIVNDAACKMTGYTRWELLSMAVSSFHEPEDINDVLNDFQRLQETGRISREYAYRHKDGHRLYMALEAVKIREDRYLAFCKDITEKRHLETELRQSQKMEAIGTLAGGIAHEFNNMLAIILGNTQLALDETPLKSSVGKSLEEIQTASLRAKDMVRQILSFARKGAARQKPVNMPPLIKESIKLMRASIPAMIEIKASITSEKSVILGDATEIHQVIMNLCTNAAHAMQDEGGELEILLENQDISDEILHGKDPKPGKYAKLTVKDSGEGIEAEILSRVFDPYFTTKQVGTGTGLGLAVVYGIVKKCHGEIRISSTAGEGTTVEVWIPRHEIAPLHTPAEDTPLPTGTERILLVDDQPALIEMTRQMLERLGYSVSDTTESLKALEMFRLNPNGFDLVITDMAMPKMPGDRLAAALLEIRKDIPVLLCTGHSDRMDEASAKKCGFAGFAHKPLDMRSLALIIRKILDPLKC